MSNGSRYSRRHYEDIARLLGAQSLHDVFVPEPDCPVREITRAHGKVERGYVADDLQQRIIQLFQTDNPTFDAQRFLAAIHNARVETLKAGMLEGLA